MAVADPIVVVIDDPRDVGERADVVLGRHVPTLSRRAARALGLQGALSIDGCRAKPSHRVALGQRLELHVGGHAQQPPPPLSVLAQTEDLVFVDKPSGLHTHRLRPDQVPALADAVAARFPECATASEDPREGGAAHRLDAETSGIVMFARSPRAWTLARRSLTDDATIKLYVALCEPATRWPPSPRLVAPTAEAPPSVPSWVPTPTPGTGLRIDAALGVGADRGTVTPRAGGTPAATVVWPVATLQGPAGPAWWVVLRLLTGHRHQARAHLAHVGLPLVGDTRYGSTASPPFWLRACSLTVSPAHGLSQPGRVDAPAGPMWSTLDPYQAAKVGWAGAEPRGPHGRER